MGEFQEISKIFYDFHTKNKAPENLDSLEKILVCQKILDDTHIYDLERQFLNLGDKSAFQKYVFTKIYSKILAKMGEFERVFTMLQVEYANTTNLNLLYLYGKLVVKNEKFDFYPSAQSALLECLKNGNSASAYYLAKSHEKSNKIKAIEYY